MENRDNNQIKKSSSIKSEDINDLKEILEIEKLSRLLEQFYSATGLSNFIVDLKGNILHGVGWKSICTEFHRKHKTSSERCLRSDTILANRLKKKEKHSIYICQNGMVDVATPIIIDGVHVANLFIGQFFFETPDKDFFSTLHEKNKREEQHSHRVSALCKRMGEALGLPEHKIEELKLVGLLHDIGKIAIDENILNKPGKLTDDEWKEIKRHPEIGYRILSTVNDMSEMAEYVLAHHEKWDGKGYPRGLKGEEIPFASRIITIADAYDAMTSERNYRSALPNEVALEELQKNAGIQFDPKLVSVFIEKVLGQEWEQLNKI